MIRVLQVIEATLGGTRRYVEDLAAAGDGSYVNAIAYGTARADDGFRDLLGRLRARDWQTFEIDLRRAVDVRHDFRCVGHLRRVIASFRPDVIHAHSSKGGAVARLAVFGSRRRPAIVYSPNAVAAGMGVQYRVAEHALAPLTDVFAAISASERRELIGYGLGTPGNVRVVSPTVRAADYAPRDRDTARAALGYPAAPLVIGIGRLAPQKDPLRFVDIVAAARERVADLRAVWVGDGELRAAMEAKIASAGLRDALTITGWLTDVRPYIAACDVFVSCAAYESFGYVTAEALAMQRPVVASAINGTIDIVKTDVGRALFPPRDVRAAAAALTGYLHDPAAAEAAAIRGREHVLDAFSPETTRRELAAAYRQAAAALSNELAS